MEDGINTVPQLTLEERLQKLEFQVNQISSVFTRFMQKPYKEQKDIVARMVPLLEMYESQTGPFVTKKKSTRIPTNRADWEKVMGLLDDGEDNWSAISKRTGIPQSTCRKYANMTPEEVAALPPGLVYEDEDENNDNDDQE